ncbi:chromosome partitioning protein ParB (plasmid) [Xylophilus rhododendri]|uniref:Chromosome partitioning protein ParB n=1 Tax=Xylophilus rhododendri TaxID=2697032 RepID=A0A857JDL9_9BURK|nr:plasmid partition protein ParG [Xylophilus rhododendri]QHJ01738.1 chromosome partitioning protein ParB [Xylophilus rhododendri]
MSKINSTLSAGRPSARTDRAAATLASLTDDAGGTKRVNFELSAEQHARLKIYATKQGKSIKDLLTEYVVGLPA